MASVTATSLNEQFMQHRMTCKVCDSEGPALCRVGLKLVLAFHQVIVDSSLEELQAQEKAQRQAGA
jgi:hypothetical protein